MRNPQPKNFTWLFLATYADPKSFQSFCVLRPIPKKKPEHIWLVIFSVVRRQNPHRKSDSRVLG
jgi:hypothetical protein